MTLWIELVGWIAAGLTLAAYSCRTMLPLRFTAVGANVFFASYGALAEIYPTLVLHVVLLPLNAYRLWEILNLTRRARAPGPAPDTFDWIAEVQAPERFEAGTVLFSAGQRADYLYYLVSGE